ncbi:MAG: hypothetical protein PHC34_13440, partial [Candidatus Gastranaerophilales bacterium]|nr:hypothetical protein [Candidatus Gastranaerophilales bacterium]
MRETKKLLITAVLLAGVYASFSIIPAYAAVATLSGIEISPANNGSYQIMVKTDKEVSVEKYITADNKIVLDLKNTKPANFVNTVYNNASKVDHVIVQPVSDEEVRIFVQGANISGSNISLSTKVVPQNILDQVNLFDNSNQNSLKNNTSSNINDINKAQPALNTVNAKPQTLQDQQIITLDRPVDNYKPVATFDEEDQLNNETPLQTTQNAMKSDVSLKKIFSTTALDWLLRFLMLAFIMIAAYKLFGPKKKIKVNISSERNREFDILKSLNKKQGLIGAGLKSPSVNKPRKSGYSSVSQYGLKEYQNSQIPPVNRTASVQKPRSEFNIPKTSINNEALLKSLKSSNISTVSKTTAPSKIKNSDITAAKVNVDSKKFLETMAKIYERSGRVDLAQGIQDNITKS